MPALEPSPVEPEAEPAPPEPGPPKSLFERLGGRDSIKAVSSELLKRLRSNDTLNKNSKIAEARKKVNQKELAEKLADFVCMAAGGQCEYKGRSMKDSHADLGITEKEWDIMAKHFVAVLKKFKVPAREQQELIELVGTTKADIVTK